MRNLISILGISIILLLVGAACGSDDSDGDATSGDDNRYGCPEKIVIQTDWFPEPEHAYLYQLIGTDGELDSDAGTYAGQIKDTNIMLEIRAGGPYINNSSPAVQFYADNDIYMAYVNTPNAIESYRTTPAVAVFANFEKGPQILMWNPDEYDFDSFADIGESDATILHFGGATYIRYLNAKGLIDESQADGSYDGSPSRFITEGNIVQQGFATAEPFKYENEHQGWLKPVDFLFIHDSGHAIYQSALSVKPETIENDSDCLEYIVPIIQQGLVDYMNDPEPINVLLNDIVIELDSFWTASLEGNNWSTRQMRELGMVTDGENDYVGDMDEDRIRTLIEEYTPILRDEGVSGFGVNDVPLKASDIFTNEFLDTTISLGY